MRKEVKTTNAPAAVGPYSQAIDTGQTLYVSGQLPLNPETMTAPSNIEDQTFQSLSNAKAIIEEAGYEITNAVKVTVLLDDINDFAEMNKVYETFFTAPAPARVCYEVASLPMGAKVEIDFVVVK